MMRLPVRILSDLHLGHRASRISDADSLRPLIRGAGTVVFNGDTWEELAAPWREKSAEMLAHLKRIITEEDCDAIFIRGNHDPGFDGPGSIALAEGRIAITHGDALLHQSSPWKREILTGAHAVEKIWSRHPDAGKELASRLEVAREIATKLPSIHYSDGRSLLSRAFDATFPPGRALAIISAWIQQGKIGAQFCERYLPEAEFLIIGHFHCAGVRQIRGKTIINTGSFVIPGPASWVSWDGQILSKGRVIESDGSFKLGGNLKKWSLS